LPEWLHAQIAFGRINPRALPLAAMFLTSCGLGPTVLSQSQGFTKWFGAHLGCKRRSTRAEEPYWQPSSGTPSGPVWRPPAGPCLQTLGEHLGVLLMETACPSVTLHARLAKCLFPEVYK